jgi:transposase
MGGHSTKIHLAVDALGNAIRFILTGGEQSDHQQASNLIEGIVFDCLIADKGYDRRAVCANSQASGQKGRHSQTSLRRRNGQKI